MKRIATVICSRCVKFKKMYGIRTEKINKQWNFTWAFPLKEAVADSERYSETVINETPIASESYNGCPYCKTKQFIYCSNCGKLNCYNGERSLTCQWCEVTGTVGNGGWGSLSGGGF